MQAHCPQRGPTSPKMGRANPQCLWHCNPQPGWSYTVQPATPEEGLAKRRESPYRGGRQAGEYPPPPLSEHGDAYSAKISLMSHKQRGRMCSWCLDKGEVTTNTLGGGNTKQAPFSTNCKIAPKSHERTSMNSFFVMDDAEMAT